MAAKVQWYRNAWWVMTHAHGRRKRNRVGPTRDDRRTAIRLAEKINGALALGSFVLGSPTDQPGPQPERRHPCDQALLHWHVAVTDEAIAADWDPDNEHPTYLPVTAMTVLMSDEAASITGLDRGYFSKVSRLRPTVDDLRDRLNAVREPGYLGDKRVIGSWVDCFGLHERYAWQPMFEEEES